MRTSVYDISQIACHKWYLIKPFSYFYCLIPNQFRIIDARTIALNDKQKNKSTLLIKDADSAINGKATYARICIKKSKSFE